MQPATQAREGAGVITHRCTSCAWVGDAPAERPVREPFEFQGHRGCETTIEQSCPDCGHDVDECAACQACGENPTDVDDLCRRCIARNYLLGIEDLKADRALYSATDGWPDVERWIAEERERMTEAHLAEFRKVMSDIALRVIA